MSDEATFLTVLKAAPDDDTARLVYADWLDEHEEPAKAEYLRLVAAFAQYEGDLATAPGAAQFLDLAVRLPQDWRDTAGARFALVLDSYTEKIHAIKWLREVTGDGLGEAKEASERLPHTVFACVPYEFATEARSRIGRPDRINTRITTSSSGPFPADAAFDLFVHCRVVAYQAGPLATARARREAERAARAALTTILAAALEVTQAEAEPRAVLDQEIPLATGLSLQEARTRRTSWSHLTPSYDSERGWSMWIYRRRITATPNSE